MFTKMDRTLVQEINDIIECEEKIYVESFRNVAIPLCPILTSADRVFDKFCCEMGINRTTENASSLTATSEIPQFPDVNFTLDITTDNCSFINDSRANGTIFYPCINNKSLKFNAELVGAILTSGEASKLNLAKIGKFIDLNSRPNIHSTVKIAHKGKRLNNAINKAVAFIKYDI